MTGKPKRTRLQLLIAVLAVITIVAAAAIMASPELRTADVAATTAVAADIP